ncbi:MAG: cell division protein ZapA [Bacteriovoracia bacterium]
MSDKIDKLEFVLLGQKVRFKPDASEVAKLPPEENGSTIVKWVEEEALNIRKKAAALDDNKLAVLTLLKIATEKKQLEFEYRSNIESLEQKILQLQKLINPSS